MNKPRIGLLPLYITLYDEVIPDLRPRLEDYATRLVSRIVQEDVEVTVAPTARTAGEVKKALVLEQVQAFMKEKGIKLDVTVVADLIEAAVLDAFNRNRVTK